MIQITKEYMKNFKVPSLAADINDQNIDVDKELKNSFTDKDITQEQLLLLKQQFKTDGKKLMPILNEFRQMRINYLMSMSYDELDKAGILQELKDKYLQGYQEKYFIKFGKHHESFKHKTAVNNKDLQTEIDRAAQFAIDNKDLTSNDVNMMKQNFKNDSNELLMLLKKSTQTRIDSLMKMNWLQLDKGNLLDELKSKYLVGFKIKYKDKFGIDYKN